jgi:hypothetical protein
MVTNKAKAPIDEDKMMSSEEVAKIIVDGIENR